MKALFYAVLCSLILSQTVMADNKSADEELLRNKLDAVVAVLQKEDLEQQAKNNEIIEIVTPIFDFSLMAKLSLGKKYWPGLTKEKKDIFAELFIKRLKESYLEKMTELLNTNNLQSLTVLHMEVPCCSGLTHIATEAIAGSDTKMQFKDVTIDLRGNVIKTENINK